MKIPVFSDGMLVDWCDLEGVRRYLGRVNVKIVRARKTGAVMRINLADNGGAWKGKRRLANGQKYTYVEAVCDDDGNKTAQLHQLKYIDTKDRSLFCLSVTDCLTA